MGNCLVLENKVVKIMRTDGKILEYKAPIKAQQIMFEFSDHAVADSEQELRQLQPDAKLVGGRLYYLVPLLLQPCPEVKKKNQKKVRFSNPEVTPEAKQESGVVRIKVIITKKELQELLEQQREDSVHDIISQIQSKQSMMSHIPDDHHLCKPVLESIPEIN